LGCCTELVELPEGRDLRDMRNEINPSDLFE
jgi:hypothetical protein